MESGYALCILGGLCIAVDAPLVLGIKVEGAAEVGVSPALHLALFDVVDGVGACAVEDVVLHGIFGIVEPCLLYEAAVEEAVVVVFDVLERMVRERLGGQEFGGLGGST
jgi:hypothetical protein